MLRTVLVTGGRGFIGANLVPRLLESGFDVRVLDSGIGAIVSAGEWPDVEFIEGDVRDAGAVERSLRGVDAIIHLAAAGSVVDSVRDPEVNFDVNVRGTFNVLHAAAKSGVQRLIFASTGGALIGNAEPPVDERSLPKPISPYGASKLCGEAYCQAFAASHGLPTVALRFANVYGPRSDGKRGAVTAFINALLRDEPLVIFGDGRASRDFIYVEDLCGGIARALEADLCAGEVIHLASGVETTVSRLAEEIRRAAGKPDHPLRYEKTRPGEVERNFADFARAKERLGFTPSVSLEEGLGRTWSWFCDKAASKDGQAA